MRVCVPVIQDRFVRAVIEDARYDGAQLRKALATLERNALGLVCVRVCVCPLPSCSCSCSSLCLSVCLCLCLSVSLSLSPVSLASVCCGADAGVWMRSFSVCCVVLFCRTRRSILQTWWASSRCVRQPLRRQCIARLLWPKRNPHSTRLISFVLLLCVRVCVYLCCVVLCCVVLCLLLTARARGNAE